MKRYIVEMCGTFFLTLAVALTGNPIAIGLMLMSMIYIGGHISGGHFNPAITLGTFLYGRLSSSYGKITSSEVISYIVAQMVGAFLALAIFVLLVGAPFSPDVSPAIPLWLSLGVEALLTSVFVKVMLTVTALPRFKGNMIYGFAIGLTLMAITFIGGIFNPAIAGMAIGWSMIKGGSFVGIHNTLIYFVGPFVGSFLGAFAIHYLNSENRPNVDQYQR